MNYSVANNLWQSQQSDVLIPPVAARCDCFVANKTNVSLLIYDQFRLKSNPHKNFLWGWKMFMWYDVSGPHKEQMQW